MGRSVTQKPILVVSPPLALLLFFICFASSQNDDVYKDTGSDYEQVRIRVGLVLDSGSVEGKMVGSSVTTALSDFYAVNSDYKTRVSLLIRNSHGEPLLALASGNKLSSSSFSSVQLTIYVYTAVDLLQTEGVEAIVTGGSSLLETKLLAEIGEKARVPVISINSPISHSLSRYSHLIQAAHDSSSEAEGIRAFIREFDWESVSLVHEDDDDWRESTQLLVEHFSENGVFVQSKVGFTVYSTEETVMDRLGKIKDSGTSVFVVHVSEFVATRHLFKCAERLGMMGEGFAWILTVKTMNSFHESSSTSGKEAMEGVVGFKSYVPVSRGLQNFTRRWRKSLGNEEDVRLSLSISSVWAHDVAWVLARAAEVARMDNASSSTLLEAITECRFKGLSGDFHVKDKMFLSHKFEIVNLLESGERRIGFWSSNGGFSSRRHFNKLEETIIWPGGSAQAPRRRVLGESKRRKLRVLVTSSNRFPRLMKVETDLATNVTTAEGFCIEVFRAAIAPFNYELEFIPWRNGSNYNKLAYALYSQKDKYDAAVGDITITANRSNYVDFTMPFTEMGLGTVAPKETSMWVFFHPLKRDLWITSAAFFVLTGTLVWLIERPDNKEFQGSWPKQIGVIFWFGFSTLVYAHREKLQHNLSRFVVTVWVFAVLILTTSYTATLTSMMTVQQIRFNSNKDFVGHLSGSLIANMALTSPRFRPTNTKGLNTSADYAEALLNNTVSFIVDELPYLKVLLGENLGKFLMIKAQCNTNGFGFMFQKGDELVPLVSREIFNLRTSDRLIEMEKRWFENQLPYTADDTSNPITLYRFRGLFMIIGVSFAFALVVLVSLWLRDRWDDLMNSVNIFLSQRLVYFRILLARTIHPNPLDDENAVQMAQRN
ncbi:Glutamate receptor 1.2 [Hirschfeldia incana]|nr:Glutamate receptor 1.2 [Hirschfeldia incana]